MKLFGQQYLVWCVSFKKIIIIWRFKNFCFTTLNRNMVIGKFLVTIRMFESFPVWVFGFKEWNDRHALRVSFGVWHFSSTFANRLGDVVFVIRVIIYHLTILPLKSCGEYIYIYIIFLQIFFIRQKNFKLSKI